MKNDKSQTPEINQENLCLDKICNSLSLICVLGTMVLISNYDEYWRERLPYKPEDYKVPSLSDFYMLLYYIPIMILLRVLIQSCLSDLNYKYFLSDKYKNVLDERLYEQGKIFHQKINQNIYKFIYFIIICSFAYYFLHNIPIFPYELGGTGDIMNIFTSKAEEVFFYKGKYFDYYYLITLSYVITDLIFLILINNSQTDFSIMIFHHILTVSLISFSYLSNISHIGLSINFLHDFSDIFVYLTRIVINTDLNNKIKEIITSMLVICFFFLRVYFFGKCILFSWFYAYDMNLYFHLLLTFCCFLYLLHIYWLYEILYRLINKKYVDVGARKIKK